MVKRRTKSRIQNVSPLKYRGIQFRSKLEVYTYKKLKEADIKADYERYTFVLMDKLEFNGKSMELYHRKGEKLFSWQKPLVRSISYKPDFVNLRDGWVIECKGHPNDAFPNKWKMFKKYLNDNKLKVDLFMPRNHKHVDIVVEYIKNNY